jgi:hypothetical protein
MVRSRITAHVLKLVGIVVHFHSAQKSRYRGFRSRGGRRGEAGQEPSCADVLHAKAKGNDQRLYGDPDRRL